MNKLFIIGLIITICLGCKEQKSKAETKPIKQTTSSVELQEEPALPIEVFTIEKIKNFGDSLVSYFNNKAGYDISWYETQIDSSTESNYEKLTITLKTQTYRTNGMIRYDIYTFQSTLEATDFFNDLKTQELIQPFGLSKRPNHILVDSNRVYWHHLEHGYGHRIKDLTGVFNNSFNFSPQSANLDSVSGFTYCHCINDDANLNHILGTWQSTKHIINYSDTVGYSMINDTLIPNVDTCFNNVPKTIRLDIKDGSIKLNSKLYKTKIYSSIDLPDNSLYWKYTVNRNESFGNHIFSVKYSKEFMDRIDEIKISKDPITVYEINLTNHCSATIVKLSESKIILILNNKYYELKKRS
jgi:hypothetical protein